MRSDELSTGHSLPTAAPLTASSPPPPSPAVGTFLQTQLPSRGKADSQLPQAAVLVAITGEGHRPVCGCLVSRPRGRGCGVTLRGERHGLCCSGRQTATRKQPTSTAPLLLTIGWDRGSGYPQGILPFGVSLESWHPDSLAHSPSPE